MMRNSNRGLLLLLVLVCSLSLFHVKLAGAQTKNLDVGVILDNSTWIGNISWSCMAMAVEDFYAVHQTYTTRLVLHPRDVPRNDTLGAASAAIDLLENVQVQAIVGPQASSQAKFVIKLGEKSQVPIISSSAKSPSLSTKQSKFFIRTAYNDTVQATVIASIIQAFGWREVVPVFEDTEYGNGIIPYLTDAFQDFSVRVPYRSSIPIQATDKEILAELSKLKKMQTRVFVVHMSYRVGMQFFMLANKAKMMEQGYVWITTYGLTDTVDLMGVLATDVMQGVLGIRPYMKKTEKFLDFQSRWRMKFNQKNYDGRALEPTAFGLWAYDTLWMLASAAEKLATLNFTYLDANVSKGSVDMERLRKSRLGPKICDIIANTKFNGLSGNMNMVDGQLQENTFEIINVVGDGRRRIGFWTPSLGISRNIDVANLTFDVIWPGSINDTPKGWEWPIGRELVIAVPKKPGFMEFVNTSRDPVTGFKGYSLEVFDSAMKQLPYNIPYRYEVYEDASGEMNGTYDDLVYQVYLKKYDAVVGDVTIIANRSLYVDFTLPYTESGVSILVPVNDKQKKGAWTFLNPLTTSLWLASGAFFIFTGFVIWILEHRINQDFRGQPSYQLGTIFYFTFSTLVFSHKEKIISNLARVVVIIWLFVVLILQSSYTASLSSALTREQLQPSINNMEELLQKGYFVGYLRDSFMPGMLKRLNFKDSQLIAYDSPKEYYEALSNGTVKAIIDEIPYLKVFLSRYCSKYAMVGHTYKTDGFGFAFPKGSPLVRDLSRAILNVTESDKMIQLEKILYGNDTCKDPESSSSSSLTFKSFWGLFVITGAASVFALVLDMILFLHKHWSILKDSDHKSFKERLKLFFRLLNEKDTSAAAIKKKDDNRDQIMATQMNSVPASRMSVSSREFRDFGFDDDAGSLPEDETPGREISRQNPDPPSFADMLVDRYQQHYSREPNFHVENQNSVTEM